MFSRSRVELRKCKCKLKIMQRACREVFKHRSYDDVTYFYLFMFIAEACDSAGSPSSRDDGNKDSGRANLTGVDDNWTYATAHLTYHVEAPIGQIACMHNRSIGVSILH
jgi:hypothetical protein